MAHLSSVPIVEAPIKFGTDGWRGIIAADFTFERLERVAYAAAKVLGQVYGGDGREQTILVGYDRRFLSETFAQTAATAASAAGFKVLLSTTYAPTPAFSWAVKRLNVLGALVITASHNPGAYSGLKVKGAFGGSVPPEVTRQIEAILSEAVLPATGAEIGSFDPWESGYGEALQQQVNLELIRSAITQGKLTVFADVMHGAATGALERLLGLSIQEINGNRDPLFDGGAPEPLPGYLSRLFRAIRTHTRAGGSEAVGLVFDGDSDRIAAVDSQGNFLSSQILIPVLLEHLATRRGFKGELVKTVSGSDLMPKVAELLGLSVFETAVGYKYIADRMLETQVLLGGEESGGIGYGHHIPERDALLSALYLLEAIAQSGQGPSQLYANLQRQTGFSSEYDRIDLPLANMEARARLLDSLKAQPLTEIAGQAVINCQTVDGYKFRLADQSWLMVRFSGTEPVLRLYCEALTLKRVHQILAWAKEWATQTSLK